PVPVSASTAPASAGMWFRSVPLHARSAPTASTPGLPTRAVSAIPAKTEFAPGHRVPLPNPTRPPQRPHSTPLVDPRDGCPGMPLPRAICIADTLPLSYGPNSLRKALALAGNENGYGNPPATSACPYRRG